MLLKTVTPPGAKGDVRLPDHPDQRHLERSARSLCGQPLCQRTGAVVLAACYSLLAACCCCLLLVCYAVTCSAVL